jgi:alkanesulfonate monooxygenase SsuD/methylene tetrahydromethanopterin reductase-like flavin-dependent oxidoreductase (luciferase family)
MAAYFGCAFSFAHFITDAGGPMIIQAYRDQFRPSRWASAPRDSIGVFVLCAETAAAAERLALSRDLSRLLRDKGTLGPVPSIAEAEAYPYTPQDRRHIAESRHRQIVGDPDQVKARLLALGADYGVDEFVVVTICHEFQARLRSYELLAEAFGLQRRAGGAGASATG